MLPHLPESQHDEPAPRRPTWTRIGEAGEPPLRRSRMAALRWRGWNMLVSTPLRHTSSVFGGHRFFSSSSCARQEMMSGC